jgi:hypothetical protein
MIAADDTDFHPKLGEPERQDQASGAGANDQNITPLHFALHPSASPIAGVSRPRSAVRECWSASAFKSGGLAATEPKTSRKSMAMTIGPISEKACRRGSPGVTSPRAWARAMIPVTIPSGGIGRAVSLRLAGDGFAVVVNYAGNEAKADEGIGRT